MFVFIILQEQMAEAFLTKYGQGYFIAESAGLEPGKMNPNVVKGGAGNRNRSQ